MLKINNHLTIAAFITLVALAGHASAQSLIIDPDGLGENKITVASGSGTNPLTSLDQIVPDVLLIFGLDPAGSLLINGPWAAEDFRMRIGFSSTLRLEGGVNLEGIRLTSLGNGGGTSTVPGRIELDNSSLYSTWNLPFPGDINSLEYQLENNSHLSIDFAPYTLNLGGWGMAPFEVGLTSETIVTERPRDLRVTRVLTGSTVTIAGNTHITRASGAEVAANGHNIIIDGGTWETNRVSAETLGDPALAEGGIDFRSGTIRIRDRYSKRYACCGGQHGDADVVDTDQSFNQDAMDALLAGVAPGTPTILELIAGQTLQFASWANPFWLDYELSDGVTYQNYWNETFIASTLEVRGGRLLLGPEGGWEANPQATWSGFPYLPTFYMSQSAFVLGSEYTGPNPRGPFVLDGGQLDFSTLEFNSYGLTNVINPNTEPPQLRSGTIRGRTLRFRFASETSIELGSAGKVLTCELSSNFLTFHLIRFADGATVSFLSPRMDTNGVTVGDGSSVTLDNLRNPYGRFSKPVQVGLNSTLLIGSLLPFGPVVLDIGAGSLVEIAEYDQGESPQESFAASGLTALSTGPGTLRLLGGALEDIGPTRRAYTVGGHLELESAGTLVFSLVTPTNATSYNIAGDLDLGGSGLSITLADELFISGEQTLINIGGTRTGTFAGVPEGTFIESRLGVDLYLSYAGGDGNDIVLTSVDPCDLNTPGVPPQGECLSPTIFQDGFEGVELTSTRSESA